MNQLVSSAAPSAFRSLRWVLAPFFLIGSFTACEPKPASPAASVALAAKKPPVEDYSHPLLNEVQLGKALNASCLEAQERKQALLIEFSAPWCSDCRKLAKIKQKAPLAEALSAQTHLVVNIGHFDQHEELLEHFKVKAIAQWSLVDTQECEKSAVSWKILKQRTLEPGSGPPVDAGQLASWLQL